MEAVLMMQYGSLDQSVSPYKSPVGNPRKIQLYPFNSMPSANYFPSHFQTVGNPPPFLSRSYPPHSSQPPLLPLPAAAPLRRAVSRSFSGPPSGKKPNKKPSSKSPNKNPKTEGKNLPENVTTVSSTSPCPKELPKDGRKVLPRNSSGSVCTNPSKCMTNANMFSGPVAFTIPSPPPSSLPLPTFSLRPKLSCNAEAAGIDAGATDDLRRLLRLR